MGGWSPFQMKRLAVDFRLGSSRDATAQVHWSQNQVRPDLPTEKWMRMTVTVLEDGTSNQIHIWGHSILLDIDEIVSIVIVCPLYPNTAHLCANKLSTFSLSRNMSLHVGMAADSPCGLHTPHKVSIAHSSLRICNNERQSQLPYVFLSWSL